MREYLRQARRRPYVSFLVAVFVLLLLAAAAAPWANVSRFRRRIVQSISAELGRPVHVGAVSFQLFPRPAFVLSDFSVEEDPAFGVEPVMTAATVTATLRANTLWRRRVDVASLDFEDPSFNLVRNADGQWDFDSILRHANGPQTQGPGPFPSVEATGARINFKFGNEKQPLSLMDADVSLSKEAIGQWHVNIQARPVRTDLDATDMGEVRVDAALRSAPASGAPSLTYHVEWRKAPLGGISRLFTGKDVGWRGTGTITADANGTLAATDLTLRAQVEGVRRAAFVPANELDLDIRCKAHYDRTAGLLSPFVCDAPLDTGSLHIAGDVALLPGRPLTHEAAAPHIQVMLHKVPANFALDLLRHMDAGVPAQASATGEINGQVACGARPVAYTPSASPCTGSLHMTRWTLALPDMRTPLTFSSWTLSAGPVQLPAMAPKARRAARPEDASHGPMRPGTFQWPEFTLAPTHLLLGAATPATITGTMTSNGPTLSVTGPASLETLLPLARDLGLAAFPTQVRSVHGGAQINLVFHAAWPAPQTGPSLAQPAATQPAGPSSWSGTVQLRDAEIAFTGWPGLVHLSSASIGLGPATTSWTDLHGSYLKQDFDGSFQYGPSQPAGLPPEWTFRLHMGEMNTAAIQSTFKKSLRPSSMLLDLMGHNTGAVPGLPRMSGDLLVDHLEVGTLPVEHAAFALQTEGRTATISSIHGKALGGALDGNGSIGWNTGAPAYQGKLFFHQAQPNALAALFHVRAWGHGTIDLELDGSTHGLSAQEIRQALVARAVLHWQKGGWDVPSLARTPLAHFNQLLVEGNIQDQTLQLVQGTSLPGVAPPLSLTGKIDFQGRMALVLRPSMLPIGGTLAHPVLGAEAHGPVQRAP